MSENARLLVPAIRWDATTGFAGQRSHIEQALSLGCGGYIFFGGEAAAVQALVAELRERTAFPLLIASDLERGAGQQFAGATGLPPLAAIGASAEEGAAARAARLTAREALSLGINWVLAPVCDLDLEKENPIVGTRSFGENSERVSELVSEWIDACQALGAMACAKHFPGHGRTAVDSHAALPSVTTSAAELRATDLQPFVAAIESGVASILTAHIAYPALDASGAPATISRAILHNLLRKDLGYDEIIVTDAMIMEGVLQGRSEAEACIDAVAAGCDLVLYPVDLQAVASAVDHAIASGRIDPVEALKSLARRDRWASWTASHMEAPSESERAWASALALNCVTEVRGQLSALSRQIDLLLVDDDVGGPYAPPSREPLRAALQRAEIDARWVEAPSMDERRSLVVALFGDIRSWKGRAGYSAASISAVSRALERDASATVLQFSHPRLAEQIPASAKHIVSAWGGERVMQDAAARWLVGRTHVSTGSDGKE